MDKLLSGSPFFNESHRKSRQRCLTDEKYTVKNNFHLMLKSRIIKSGELKQVKELWIS